MKVGVGSVHATKSILNVVGHVQTLSIIGGYSQKVNLTGVFSATVCDDNKLACWMPESAATLPSAAITVITSYTFKCVERLFGIRG